jgi:hypothetical protein
MVYRLRSPEADGLFERPGTFTTNSVYEIPAVRTLLLQLAALDLSERDLEALVRNWNNDVTFLVDLAKSRRL